MLALLAFGFAKPYPDTQTGDTAHEIGSGNSAQTTNNNTTVNISIGGSAPGLAPPPLAQTSKESTPTSQGSGSTVKPTAIPLPEPPQRKVKELIAGDQVISVVQPDDGLGPPFGKSPNSQPEPLAASRALDSVKIVPKGNDIQDGFGSN